MRSTKTAITLTSDAPWQQTQKSKLRNGKTRASNRISTPAKWTGRRDSQICWRESVAEYVWMCVYEWMRTPTRDFSLWEWERSWTAAECEFFIFADKKCRDVEEGFQYATWSLGNWPIRARFHLFEPIQNRHVFHCFTWLFILVVVEAIFP